MLLEAIAAGSSKLNADIEVGHRSSTLCHLGNIVARTGESVEVPKKSVVTFKAGNKMAERVARCEEAVEPAITDGRPG